jgi:hypothetical protein
VKRLIRAVLKLLGVRPPHGGRVHPRDHSGEVPVWLTYDEAANALKTIDRIRDIHTPGATPGVALCLGCGHYHPCPTIRAIEETP